MKYICFDIGNVLFHCDFEHCLATISKLLNISVEDAQYFLKRFQKFHDLGHTILENELKDKFNVKSPFIIKEIIDSWNDSVVPNMNILNKIQEHCNKSNLQVALLSNIGLEHAERVKQLIIEKNVLTYAVKHFSCYVGASKPALLFYQSFLIQNPQFAGSVYYDDLIENLEMAQSIGLNGRYFSLLEENENVLINDLQKLIDCP